MSGLGTPSGISADPSREREGRRVEPLIKTWTTRAPWWVRGGVVPGVDMAMRTMRPGGIRQVIVPYGSLSYPPSDLEHNQVGPKPATFSGQRALNFVLENPRVDRTLLFNIKLIRVDKKDGKGGFVKGTTVS